MHLFLYRINEFLFILVLIVDTNTIIIFEIFSKIVNIIGNTIYNIYILILFSYNKND